MEDTLTVPRLRALKREWERTPPMPVLLAAWLGVKPQEQGTTEALLERLQALAR